MTNQVVSLKDLLRFTNAVGVAFQTLSEIIDNAQPGEANAILEDVLPNSTTQPTKTRTRRTKAEIEADAEKVKGGTIYTHVPAATESEGIFAPSADDIFTPGTFSDEPVVEDIFAIPEVVLAPVASKYSYTKDTTAAEASKLCQEIVVDSAKFQPNFMNAVAGPMLKTFGGTLIDIHAAGRLYEFLSELEKAALAVQK